MDSYQLTPQKEGFTPINLATVTRQINFQRQYSPSLNFDENHFDMTPINERGIPGKSQLAVPKYQAIDFSPMAPGGGEKEEYVENGSESKHHKQIKFGPEAKKNQYLDIYDEENNEDDDEDDVRTVRKNKRSKKNSSKGLKTLSLTVADIAKEKLKVTYKDIANLLIEKFINEGKIPPADNVQL